MGLFSERLWRSAVGGGRSFTIAPPAFLQNRSAGPPCGCYSEPEGSRRPVKHRAGPKRLRDARTQRDKRPAPGATPFAHDRTWSERGHLLPTGCALTSRAQCRRGSVTIIACNNLCNYVQNCTQIVNPLPPIANHSPSTVTIPTGATLSSMTTVKARQRNPQYILIPRGCHALGPHPKSPIHSATTIIPRGPKWATPSSSSSEVNSSVSCRATASTGSPDSWPELNAKSLLFIPGDGPRHILLRDYFVSKLLAKAKDEFSRLDQRHRRTRRLALASTRNCVTGTRTGER